MVLVAVCAVAHRPVTYNYSPLTWWLSDRLSSSSDITHAESSRLAQTTESQNSQGCFLRKANWVLWVGSDKSDCRVLQTNEKHPSYFDLFQGHALYWVRCGGSKSCGARDKTPGQKTPRQTFAHVDHKPAVAALCVVYGPVCDCHWLIYPLEAEARSKKTIMSLLSKSVLTWVGNGIKGEWTTSSFITVMGLFHVRDWQIALVGRDGTQS